MQMYYMCSKTYLTVQCYFSLARKVRTIYLDKGQNILGLLLVDRQEKRNKKTCQSNSFSLG